MLSLSRALSWVSLPSGWRSWLAWVTLPLSTAAHKFADRPAGDEVDRMSIDAIGIHIGPLTFRFYGFILMAGAIAAAYLGRRMIAKMGEKEPDIALDALFWG